MKKESELSLKSEDFYQIAEVSQPRLSPDGKTVVYTYQSVDKFTNKYKKTLWLKELDKSEPYQFTSGCEKDDFAPSWSPDGKKITFLSNRSEKVQIWQIPLHGGEAKLLTSMKNGIESFVWSPDGKKIAFISRMNKDELKAFLKPSKLEKFKDLQSKKCAEEAEKKAEETKIDPRIVDRVVFRTGTTFRDDRHALIFILDIKTGKIKNITSDERDYESPVWAPDGKSLFTSANFTGDEDNNPASQIIKINIRRKKKTFLTEDENVNAMPLIAPDGKKIVFITLPSKRLSSRNSFLQVTKTDGSHDSFEITPTIDRDILDFKIDSRGEWVYFLVTDRGSVNLNRVSINGGEVESIYMSQGLIDEFHISKNGDGIVFSLQNPEIPSDIYYCSLDNFKISRLTNVNEKLLAKKFISKPEEFWWKTDDDFEIQGWLMKPKNFDSSKKYPCIVEVHGGPHIMWGNSFWLEFQAMVSKGYVVFFCNPRGSDGYGEKFKGAIYQDWGENDAQDILTGLNKAVEMGFIDEKRLFVTGGSYGGYMTAWLIGHDQRFKAAVSQRGVYNLTSFYGCSDAQMLIEWEFDTFPWENPELLWQHSPLAYAPMIKTPLLIIHSDLDYRAPINTAEELFTALKKLKAEVIFVRYPREGHELSRSGEPKHRVDRINRIIGWFDNHLN